MKYKRLIPITIYALFIISLVSWWSSKNLFEKKVQTESLKEESIAAVHSIYGSGAVKLTVSGIVANLTPKQAIKSEESIRVYEDSHLTLILGGSNDRLELGANSEVLLVEQNKTLEVHVLEGEVYLSAHGDRKNFKYSLHSANVIAQVENADVILLTHNQKKPQFEVFRGEVQIVLNNKNYNLQKDQYLLAEKKVQIHNREFQVVTPLPYDRIFLSSEVTRESVPVRFAWAGVSEFSKIELLTGNKPTDLRSEEIKIQPTAKEFIYSLPLGVHYWQIRFTLQRAKNKKSTIVTSVSKIFVESESPAILLEPLGRVASATRQRLSGVLFRWANSSNLERLLLEVSKDKEFNTNLLRQPLKDGADAIITNIEGDGDFYWRVNGFRHDTSELITSAVGRFQIITTDEPEPEVYIPENNSVFSLKSVEKGQAQLRWKSVGLTNYKIEVLSEQEKTVFEANVVGDSLTLPVLPKGRYKVSFQVASMPQARRVLRNFEIVETAEISWKNISMVDRAINEIEKLSWNEGPASTEIYKVKIHSFFPVKEDRFHEYVVSDLQLEPDLPEDGVYLATVQAYSKESRLLGESRPLLFKIGN